MGKNRIWNPWGRATVKDRSPEELANLTQLLLPKAPVSRSFAPEQSLRLCGQFLHWLRWVRGQWRGRFRVTNLYLRNIRRVVLWARIHASHNNNLLCCVLKCVTPKAINGRYLFSGKLSVLHLSAPLLPASSGQIQQCFEVFFFF